MFCFKKNKKAFTLVELIVVIAIIAILGTVVGLSVTQFVAKAKENAVTSSASAIQKAWDTFVADGGDKQLYTYFSENVSDISNVYIKPGKVNGVTYDNVTGNSAHEASLTLYVYKEGYLATITVETGKASLASVRKNQAVPSGAKKMVS